MLRNIVGIIGAQVIYTLIWLFGRRYSDEEISWLVGPLGGDSIGDRPYEETAAAEGLTLVRNANEGGLIPKFEALRSATFNPDQVHPKIIDFYENTHRFSLDTWATTYFPAKLALWLLVATISRRVNQLNFPLDGLDTAYGMTSEIILLREPDGEIRYTGWFRKLARDNQVIYTGFYMTQDVPNVNGACVKVVFPMPNGNATVILRPEHDDSDGMRLISAGRGFGDAGFYRMQRSGPDRLRVWRVQTLHERFELFVDEEEVVRCEHAIRFLGLPVLTLHYRIQEKNVNGVV